MCPPGDRRMIGAFSEEVPMFAVVIVCLVVAAILGYVLYALVRPFTHTHYVHPTARLWRPLD
jgi:hypothetical protein